LITSPGAILAKLAALSKITVMVFITSLIEARESFTEPGGERPTQTSHQTDFNNSILETL
jgi:hypothetical protein